MGAQRGIRGTSVAIIAAVLAAIALAAAIPYVRGFLAARPDESAAEKTYADLQLLKRGIELYRTTHAHIPGTLGELAAHWDEDVRAEAAKTDPEGTGDMPEQGRFSYTTRGFGEGYTLCARDSVPAGKEHCVSGGE